MKNIIFCLVFIFALSACSQDENSEGRFIETYRQILIARETIPDSVQANTAVSKIIQKNGYTESSFKEEFFNLAKDKKSFGNLIDSVRKSILNDSSVFK